MTPIGGYFERERLTGRHSRQPNRTTARNRLARSRWSLDFFKKLAMFEISNTGRQSLHSRARLTLNSGRSCLSCLLELEQPTAVWLPYYSCNALLEPFHKARVPVKFYALSHEMTIDSPPPLAENERLLVIHYFGLQAATVNDLEQRYAERLWVDNTQAFFLCPEHPRAYHFNSARKFFGVPDGASLYAPEEATIPPPETWPRNTEYRYEHLDLRSQGRIAAGREIFRDNERRNGGDISQISALSEEMLGQLDYEQIARTRRENYQFLHQELGRRNRLSSGLLALDASAVPYCYPFLPWQAIPHEHLWDQQIFAPVLWRECCERIEIGYEWEKQLSNELLPLPIDQRYGRAEMEYIVKVLSPND